MKTMLRGVVACVLVSAPIASYAADATLPMATKVPAAPLASSVTATPDWSGFYLGVNAGTLDVDSGGALVGGTAGYNFQTGALVLGIEGDVDAVFPNGGGSTDTLGTIRGRIGYTFSMLMPYFTAGYGFGPDSLSGLAIGGGVEFHVTSDLSLKAEYIYLDYDQPDNMVRVGLNWHFKPNAPVVARY